MRERPAPTPPMHGSRPADAHVAERRDEPPPFRRAPGFRRALAGLSRRGDYDEILDQPRPDRRALAGNLRDLRLMNRWLGWSDGVWREVRPLLAGCRRATLLDLATGSADVPRALTRRAARAGIRLRALGSDVSVDVLGDARRASPGVILLRHDAAQLPLADGTVDVVTLCLAAHHLDPPVLAATLREMGRVARRGIVVSDLERGRLAYLGARLMALVLRNPLTSHDGPVSVLRAYSAAELRGMAAAAGLAQIRVRRRFPFRLTLVARPPRQEGGGPL